MNDRGLGTGEADPNGRIINDRYRVLKRLGLGAMGEVYAAHDIKLDRDVAIKLLKRELTADPTLRARFEREARAAGRLSHHPNVVTVFDVDEADEQPFMVMELVSSGTLSDRIKAGGISVDEAVEIVLQILSALSFAHSNGILHRDIKPSNILVSADGVIKVGDFGIATILENTTGPSELTLTSQVIGTPAYLSPERAMGKPSSASSDIFSVGVILYEMVTGSKPYKGDTPIAVILAVQSGKFTPAEAINSDVSIELSSVISRALSPGPEDRYSSADHMAAALRFKGVSEDTIPLRQPNLAFAAGTDTDQTMVLASMRNDATVIEPIAQVPFRTTEPVFGTLVSERVYELLKIGSEKTLQALHFLSNGVKKVASRLPDGLKRSWVDLPNGLAGFLIVGVVAFLLVMLVLLNHTPPQKAGPTTSVVTTLPATTIAPPTTTPTTVATIPVTSLPSSHPPGPNHKH